MASVIPGSDGFSTRNWPLDHVGHSPGSPRGSPSAICPTSARSAGSSARNTIATGSGTKAFGTRIAPSVLNEACLAWASAS